MITCTIGRRPKPSHATIPQAQGPSRSTMGKGDDQTGDTIEGGVGQEGGGARRSHAYLFNLPDILYIIIYIYTRIYVYYNIYIYMYIRHGGCGNFVASVSLFRFLFFLYVDTLLAQPWLLLWAWSGSSTELFSPWSPGPKQRPSVTA